MYDLRADILRASEDAFDRGGFAATGVDRLAESAQVSTRTLYKHFGGKTGITVAVLEARSARFLASLEGRSIDGLFTALEEWHAREGARGCLFLRARAETGGLLPPVNETVDRYRELLRARIAAAVTAALGRVDPDAQLQILVLFEGAVSAATYQGAAAIAAARQASASVLASRPDGARARAD